MRKLETALPCAAAERLFFAWGACQGGGCCGFCPRRWNGRERSPPGQASLKKIGERRRPRKEVPFPWNHSLVEEWGKVVSQVGLACGLKTNASWPAHQLRRAGEVVFDVRRRETERLFSAFSQRYLLTSPARPAGGRAVTSVTKEGRRPGTRKSSLPPPSHQRRESRGKNLFPLGFFPPFLPKKWGPGWASHRSLPFQRRRNCPPLPEKPEAAARFPRGGFFHFSLFADLDEAQ